MADDKKGLYVSNRDVRLETTFGVSIEFKKGEPVYVHPLARKAAVEIGILPVDQDALPFEEKTTEAAPAPEGDERSELIEEALAEIRDRNDVSEFNAHGVPKVQVAQDILGFEISANELKNAWMALKAKG